MSSRFEFTKREVMGKLNKKIAEKKAHLALWEQVEIVTKKDGKPFTDIKRNFKNAVYRKISYSIGSYSYELVVYGHYPVYVSEDSINYYRLVKYMGDDDNRAKEKPQNIAPHETYRQHLFSAN